MYIHCTWPPLIVCMYHYRVYHCILDCTTFDIGMYNAVGQDPIIVYIQGYTSYIPPKNGY